jgi:hypothetical protein
MRRPLTGEERADMTFHHVGARPPAGFQDANYFSQGGDAASGARRCVQLSARLVCMQNSMRFRIEAAGSRMKYDRDTIKEWAGSSQWRALQADYRRFRLHGHTGWGSEGFWAVAIYRMQRALRKSRTPWLWAPASVLLAIARKLLQILTSLDLHPGA